MWTHVLVYLLLVAQTTLFGQSDVCKAKGEWVEDSIEGHIIHVGGLYVGEGTHGVYEVTFIKRWVPIEK